MRERIGDGCSLSSSWTRSVIASAIAVPAPLSSSTSTASPICRSSTTYIKSSTCGVGAPPTAVMMSPTTSPLWERVVGRMPATSAGEPGLTPVLNGASSEKRPTVQQEGQRGWFALRRTHHQHALW